MTINLKSRVAAGEMVGRVGADIDGVDLSGTYARPAAVVAPGVNGVVGNGVVDDRAAIQAVIDGVEAATDEGGTILFAAGVYQIGGVGLDLSGTGVHLRGSGIGELTAGPIQGATVLRAMTSGTTLTGNLISVGASMCSVSDMTLDGGTVGDACLFIDNAVRCTFQRLLIRNAGSQGIECAHHANMFSHIFILDAVGIGVYLPAGGFDSQFSNIWIGGCDGAGIRTESGAQFFSNLHVWGCGGDGVEVRSNHNRFVNVYLETNGGDGIDFFNASGSSVIGGALWDNGAHGCTITGTSTRNRIIGLEVYNNTSNGIHIAGDRNQVIGCNCYDDQGGSKTQDTGINILSGTRNLIAGNVSEDADHTTAGITDAGTFTDNRDKLNVSKHIAYSPTLAYKAAISTPAALVANTAHFIPFILERPTPIDTIVFEVGTASGNVDVGIYDDDGTSGAPGTRLASSGSTACPASGGAGIALAPGVLPPGRYYAALVADNATATFRYGGQSNVAAGMGQEGYTQASAFPLPATAGATVSTATNQFQFCAAIT